MIPLPSRLFQRELPSLAPLLLFPSSSSLAIPLSHQSHSPFTESFSSSSFSSSASSPSLSPSSSSSSSPSPPSPPSPSHTLHPHLHSTPPPSSPPSPSSVLSSYRRLLRITHKLSNGHQQKQKSEMILSQNPDLSAMFTTKHFQYDTQFVKYIRKSFRDNKILSSSSSSHHLLRRANDMITLYEANISHSTELLYGGWGLAQGTKNQVKNAAKRVGLDVTEEGQKVVKREHTKLTGTAAERFKIGEGYEIKNNDKTN